MPGLVEPWVRVDEVIWSEAYVHRPPIWGRGQGPHRILFRGATVHTLEPYPDPRLNLPPFWAPLAFETDREAHDVLDAYRYLDQRALL